MTAAVRVVLLAAILLQAFHLVRVTRHDAEYVAGVQAHRGERFQEALERFEKARRHWRGQALTWEWAGDTAVLLYDRLPPQALNGPQGPDLLRRGWRGYAGAVLRNPGAAWSWSGLAEVATREADLLDARQGLDLAALGRRAQGVLDGRRGVALAAARLAVRLKPSGFQELDTLAALYGSAGDTARAERALVRSARMMPAPSFHVWGRGDRLSSRLYAAVLASVEEGIARAPTFERSLLHRELGDFAWTQRDEATALRHYGLAEDTAEHPHERYAAVAQRARVLEQMGRGNEAIAAYRQALALEVAPAVDAQLLGSLELRLGRPVEACADLRTALRHGNPSAGLREQAAAACEQAGETELAESLLRDGLVDPSTMEDRACALLDLYWRTGRRSMALRLAEQWLVENAGLQRVAAWVEQHEPGSP